jgi:tetratricopeptide (TPR) repeat protein
MGRAAVAALVFGALAPLVWNGWEDLARRGELRAAAARHAAIGESALAAGDPEAAIVAFQRAESLSSSAAVRRDLVRAQVEFLIANPAGIAREAALPLAQEIELALDARPAGGDRYLVALGNIAVIRGDEDAARTRFEQALVVDASSAPAHYFLGNAELRRGRVEDAVPHFEAALRARPQDWQARKSLGIALLRKPDLPAALPELERALAAGGPAARDAELRSALGDAYFRLERYAQAAQALEAALAVNPGLAALHDELGLSYFKLGRHREAIEQLTLSFQKTRNLTSYFNLGVLYATVENHAQAARIFAEVIAAAPGLVEAYYRLAISAARAGDAQTAREAARRFVAAAHGSPSLEPEVHEAEAILGNAAPAAATATAK